MTLATAFLKPLLMFHVKKMVEAPEKKGGLQLESQYKWDSAGRRLSPASRGLWKHTRSQHRARASAAASLVQARVPAAAPSLDPLLDPVLDAVLAGLSRSSSSGRGHGLGHVFGHGPAVPAPPLGPGPVPASSSSSCSRNDSCSCRGTPRRAACLRFHSEVAIACQAFDNVLARERRPERSEARPRSGGPLRPGRSRL